MRVLLTQNVTITPYFESLTLALAPTLALALAPTLALALTLTLTYTLTPSPNRKYRQL